MHPVENSFGLESHVIACLSGDHMGGLDWCLHQPAILFH